MTIRPVQSIASKFAFAAFRFRPPQMSCASPWQSPPPHIPLDTANPAAGVQILPVSTSIKHAPLPRR